MFIASSPEKKATHEFVQLRSAAYTCWGCQDQSHHQVYCNWVCTRPVRGPRGTLSSPTRRRRGGPVTARRRRAGPGRGAARTGRSTSCVRRRAERTCGAWRRRTAVSGAGPAAVCGESRRWALGGTRGDRACRGAVHACVHGGRAKQGGGSGAAAPAASKWSKALGSSISRAFLAHARGLRRHGAHLRCRCELGEARARSRAPRLTTQRLHC